MKSKYSDETDCLIRDQVATEARGLSVSWLVSIVLVLLCVTSSLYFVTSLTSEAPSVSQCNDQCNIQLVESIPEGLVFNSTVSHPTTFAAWKKLLELTESSLELAGMYWTLRGSDVWSDPSDWEGEEIFRQLSVLAADQERSLRIAQSKPRPGMPNKETEELAGLGAELRTLDFQQLMGGGILHTKLWIADGRHFYVGSANFDWRSLTQVKELGVLVTNCSCLAEDIAKIWQVYWDLGGQTEVPPSWPTSYSTDFNAERPVEIKSEDLSVYLSSSPPPFCPEGREKDLDAILKVINNAEEFVHIAVMDYFPTTIYTPHSQFWPFIDDALRAAAINRGVKVRLLASHWDHTRPAMVKFLTSLQDISGDSPRVDIQVRMFTVPAFTPEQEQIPFGRVNHNKYMVTDQEGFIGTSNWSGDYFISTGGISFVFSGKLRTQLVDIFQRDWTSAYAHPLQTEQCKN